MPEWRNWQTRMVQVHVPVMGVEVQILSQVLGSRELRVESPEPEKVLGDSGKSVQQRAWIRGISAIC